MKIQKGCTRHSLFARFLSPVSPAWAVLALFLGIAFLSGCAPKNTNTADDLVLRKCSPDKLFANTPATPQKHLAVTARAYTAQSSGHPKNSRPRAANVQCLTPDVSAIAVSPDLIREYGLCLNTTVRLSGLEGEYKVMDIMNARYRKCIDIYYGNDQAGAIQWGRRTLTLSWE